MKVNNLGFQQRLILACCLVTLLVLSLSTLCYATPPLSIHPKLGVLQRGFLMVKVVSKEKDNKIYKNPSRTAAVAETVGPLNIFFVFPAQKNKPKLTNSDFYHISWSPIKDDIIGWIHKDNVQEWFHREMVKFASLTGRKQALVFKSKTDLLTSISKPNDSDNITKAISREPADASTQRQKILLPILEVDQMTISGELTAGYKIAYLHHSGVSGSGPPHGTPLPDTSLDSGQASTKVDKDGENVKKILKSIKLDIMFVMDMTRSMQPVIRESVKVVKHLTEEAKGLREGGGIRVGLVGYRDRIKDQQKMGFVVRQFSSLTEKLGDFMGILQRVKEADVSSEDYPEAMFDGLKDAIENTQWSENGLKVIVLIGDASAHKPGSAKNPENISLDQIVNLAGEKSIRICPLKMILNGDNELHRKQLRRLLSGISGGTQGTYGEFNGSNQAGLDKFVEDTKALMTSEANNLQDLIGRHVQIAQAPKNSQAVQTLMTPKTNADYIILENINHSIIDALRKQGKNPNEPVFSVGWIAEKQQGKDVITPHVLMSDTELQVLSLYLRGIKGGADKSSEVWKAMMRTIESTTGEKISVDKNVAISDILQKKHGLPIKTSLLRFTFDEMKDWTPEVRRDILEKVNRKLQLIDSISNDPSQFKSQGSNYLIAYIPVKYLP